MRTNNRNRYHFLLIGGGKISTLGGVLKFYCDLSDHLVKKGHKVTILVNGHENEKPFYTYHPSVKIVFLKYPRTTEKAWKFGVAAQLINPDVIVAKFSNRVGLTAMLGLYGTGIPILRAEHGNPDHIVETIWEGDAEQRALSFIGADTIHLLSSEFRQKQPLPDTLLNRMFIVSSPVFPVDQCARVGSSINGKFRILYSGRIEEYEKNSMLLLDAFLSVADDFPRWELVFCGDGTLRNEMENVARKANLLNKSVFFRGSLPPETLKQEYLDSHLFVIPSETEGAPIALGEALAYGIPSIGFADCTGTNERILHNENGLLVKSDIKNREARGRALADGMRKLMSEDSLREQMGHAAHRSVFRYHPDTVFDKWEQELAKLASVKKYLAEIRSDRVEKMRNSEPALFSQMKKITEKVKVKYPSDNKFNRQILNQIKGDRGNAISGRSMLNRVAKLFRIQNSNNTYEISIVVSSYNKGLVLEETIVSILNQKGIRLELILVDDGSTDNSKDILSKFEKDARVSVYYRSNQGVSAARNFGLSNATGEYVLFWDGDDVLKTNILATIVGKARKQNADIVTSALFHFRHNTGKKWIMPKYWLMRAQGSKSSNIYDDTLLRYDVSASNKVFRRDFLLKNNLFFESGIRLEDILFSWKAHIAAKRVFYSGDTIGGYRKFGKNGVLKTGSAVWSEVKVRSVPKVYKDLLHLIERADEKYQFKRDIDIFFISIFAAAGTTILQNETLTNDLLLRHEFQECLDSFSPDIKNYFTPKDRDIICDLCPDLEFVPIAQYNTENYSQSELPRVIRLLESHPFSKRLELDTSWSEFSQRMKEKAVALGGG